jgi:hypothetical protein
VINAINAKKRCKTLSDMKHHIENDHNKDTSFFHLKINRIFKENVDCKSIVTVTFNIFL